MRRTSIALLVGLASTSCGGPTTASDWTPQTTDAPVFEVTTAEALDIELDEDGRPFEIPRSWWADDVVPEIVSQLTVPRGDVVVLDGNALEVDPWFFRDQATSARFGSETLDLTFFWDGPASAEYRSPLAVLVAEPGAEIARWSAFEYGYGTDGGVGAVSAQSVVDAAESLGNREMIAADEVDYEASHQLFDLDEVPGIDSVIFSNGIGDGGYPMVRGFDRGGDLVAIVVWHNRHPWRLVFPEIEPPPTVRDRERELIECMAGERGVRYGSQCESDL